MDQVAGPVPESIPEFLGRRCAYFEAQLRLALIDCRTSRLPAILPDEGQKLDGP